MDAFTENILARARERQRMLQGYPSEEKTPLREQNKATLSEPNLREVQKVPQKEVRSETDIPSRVSCTKEITSQGSPGQQTKTLNIQRDDFNMEIKVNSAENVRLQVEIEERSDDSNEGSEENVGMREESKNRLKRLGKLYAGGDDADISSPIHRTEAKFYQNMEDSTDKENHKFVKGVKGNKGLSKLADLAKTINQWEDDLSHPTCSAEKSSPTKKSWKNLAPQPPTEKHVFSPHKWTPTRRPQKPKAPTPPSSTNSTSPKKALFQQEEPFTNYESNPENGSGSPTKEIAQNSNSSTRGLLGHKGGEFGECAAGSLRETPKNISWDQKVLDTLESQGFTRTQSSSRLVYSYNSQDPGNKGLENRHTSRAHLELRSDSIPEETFKKSRKIEKPKNPQSPESPSKQFRSGGIANRAAMFERRPTEAPVKRDKDPALLSLAERKALFEKNKGEALIPKAAFAMSAPVKVDTTMKACESKFIGASKNLVQTHKNLFEANKASEAPQKSPASQAPKSKSLVPPPPLPELKIVPPMSKTIAPTVAVVHQAGGIASKMAALLENKNKSTISEEQIINKVKEERQKELDMLLNRFNRNKEIRIKEDEVCETYSDIEDKSESDEEDIDERTAMLKGKPTIIVQSEKSRKSAEKRKSGNEADSPNVASVLDEVKRIKVSPPKAGRLYPNLSDIEATTTDHDTRTPTPNEENSCDSDDPNNSFGREILQTVCKNITPTRKVQFTPKDSSSGSENSSVMDELDQILEEMGDNDSSSGAAPPKLRRHVSPKFTSKDSSSGSENSSIMDDLDEILEEMEDDDSSNGPTPPKLGRHVSPKHIKPQQSNSFHYKSFTSTSSKSPNSQKSHFQSPKKSSISPRQSTELPVIVDGEQVMSLTHTVSFYRKQQNEVHTPVRHIVRQPMIEEVAETDHVGDDEVQEKIKHLQEEVNKQQNIISQTSQALNLCSSTPEFSGSTEQVEAERVLLVATHRRQAALHELQRLKVEGTIRPSYEHSQNLPLEKGTLTISDIILPLKQKYVTALAAAGGKGHHVVCLIKCGEQVVPTKLVSTVASSSKNPDVDLYVPGSVTLNNMYSDFTVVFEVYCLQAQEECLPHEVKYHINKKPTKGLTTPKKNKQDSRLVRPPKESPGGPQAVRTSSFAVMGYVVFSVFAVNKKVWSLNNTPSMSPLEGSVQMKISCELAVSVEHKGFLTMFEDISGFGAWHRRWCVLQGQALSYWKYPEDEKKKAPIDTIDLKNCITQTVGPVSRDICARLHTFLLERERQAYPQDKDTLVMVRKGDKTIIRHLLSADTKEERLEWCYKLNAALTALRMWGNTQQ